MTRRRGITRREYRGPFKHVEVADLGPPGQIVYYVPWAHASTYQPSPRKARQWTHGIQAIMLTVKYGEFESQSGERCTY